MQKARQGKSTSYNFEAQDTNFAARECFDLGCSIIIVDLMVHNVSPVIDAIRAEKQ